MANVLENIVSLLLRSLCFHHYHEFEAFHSKIPEIQARFEDLHPQSELVSLMFHLFPPFPDVMNKQQWKILHAWATDEGTNPIFGNLFKDLSFYGITCINSCEVCQSYCSIDLTEATAIRNDQVFFSSLATLDRKTIVDAARNYPNSLKEYKDSSRYVGEYADMERRLNKALDQLSVSKKIIKKQRKALEREQEENNRLEKALYTKSWTIRKLGRENQCLHMFYQGHPMVEHGAGAVVEEISDAESNCMWDSEGHTC